MSITQDKKQDLIKNYSKSKNDTGSVEVQCAIFSERIKNLTDHLANNNKKDTQAKRGLIILVNRRRKLLKYLERNDNVRYQELIKRLGLRK
jgi:small subunit ribosomal protein S15